MSKIDVSQWKEFKLSSMFDICYGSFVPKKDRGTKTPFITTSSENNGISYYVDSDPMFKGDALTVASDGSVGATFYHDKPFSAGNIAVVLEPHDDIRAKWTPKSALFIATCIRKYAQIRHSWTDKYSVNRVRDTMLPLPVDSSGEPDWHYMDEYITKRAALAHKYVSELKSTKNQRKPLKISGWQEYKISDLFEPEFTDGDNKVQNLEQSDDGVNLVGPLNSNNGVLGKFISDTKVFPAGTLTWDMFGKCYEQFEPYQTVSHGHVLVLNPKVKLDEFSLLFVASVLTRLGQNSHFGYSNMLTISKFNKLTIKLPALADGTPDWATMRKRVADLAALSHRDVTSLDPTELPIFVGNWKEFKVGDLLTKVETKKVPFKALDLPVNPTDNCDLPLVAAGVDNQGRGRYVDSKYATVLHDCLTVSANGANSGATFYQDSDFSILQDAYALKLVDKYKSMGIDNIYLFLAAVIRRGLINNDWSNKATWTRVQKTSIKLPVTSSGEPDWHYMDNYVALRKSIASQSLNKFHQIFS